MFPIPAADAAAIDHWCYHNYHNNLSDLINQTRAKMATPGPRHSIQITEDIEVLREARRRALASFDHLHTVASHLPGVRMSALQAAFDDTEVAFNRCLEDLLRLRRERREEEAAATTTTTTTTTSGIVAATAPPSAPAAAPVPAPAPSSATAPPSASAASGPSVAATAPPSAPAVAVAAAGAAPGMSAQAVRDRAVAQGRRLHCQYCGSAVMAERDSKRHYRNNHPLILRWDALWSDGSQPDNWGSIP